MSPLAGEMLAVSQGRHNTHETYSRLLVAGSDRINKLEAALKEAIDSIAHMGNLACLEDIKRDGKSVSTRIVINHEATDAQIKARAILREGK